MLCSLRTQPWTPALQIWHWGSAIRCLSGNWSLDGVRRQKQSAPTLTDSQCGRMNRCHIISLFSIRFQIQLNIIYGWIFTVSAYRNRPPPLPQTILHLIGGTMCGWKHCWKHTISNSTHPVMKVNKFRSKPLLVIVLFCRETSSGILKYSWVIPLHIWRVLL